MKELVDLHRFKEWVLARWRNSFGYVVTLVIGVLIGMLAVEWRVTDDCRYIKAFRFGSQAFTCVRTI